MSWKVTLVDINATSGILGEGTATPVYKFNVVPEPYVQFSTRPRASFEGHGGCVDTHFSPTIKDPRFSVFNSLKLKETIFEEKYPYRYADEDPTIITGPMGEILCKLEYPIKSFEGSIFAAPLQNSSKYDCPFEFKAKHITTASEYDQYHLKDWVKSGTKFPSDVREFTEATVVYPNSDAESVNVSFGGNQPVNLKATPTEGEINSLIWPHIYVKKNLASLPDSTALITMGDKHGYYTLVNDYWMFETHVVSQLQWKLVAWNREVNSSSNSGPGFLKGTVGYPPISYWVDADREADSSLGPFLQSVIAHVDRAKCFGLWDTGTALDIYAHWLLDREFEDELMGGGDHQNSVNVVAEYNGQVASASFVAPIRWSDDSNITSQLVARFNINDSGNLTAAEIQQ